MSFTHSVFVPFSKNSVSSLDLEEIQRRIALLEPNLLFRFYDVSKAEPHWVSRTPKVPTMRWDFHNFTNKTAESFKGLHRSNAHVHKAIQLKQLENTGINVPVWARLKKGLTLDPSVFGNLVMMKSTEPGSSRGHGIKLLRTNELQSEINKLALQYQSVGRSAPIVQRFINTGEKPTHYRVITFMGHPILSHMSIASDATPIAAPMNKLEITAKALSNMGERQQVFADDKEVIDLAVAASNAMSDRALVAHDIVRDQDSGQLYVLEQNTGNVWAFSGKLNAHLRETLGIENMYNQYNALDVVAREIVAEAERVLL